MTKKTKTEALRDEAQQVVEERILDLLVGEHTDANK
jgi:ATP-dependent protease HslVU (ClpYQ) ATPase subunit